MVDRIVTLATLIARYYGHPLTVRGHRDWSGINGEPDGCTTCPGRLECAVSVAGEKILAAFPSGAMSTGTALVGNTTPGATPQGATFQRATPQSLSTGGGASSMVVTQGGGSIGVSTSRVVQ
jgi:hypothetical protein